MATIVKGYVRTERAVLETRLAVAEARLASLEGRVQDDALTKELGGLRERVAVIEVRPVLPGPPGDPGPPGRDGADGKAGLTFCGIFNSERTYDHGDIVKWGGSTYHCLKSTTGVKPDAVAPHSTAPDGSMEFRGVNGKDFWELFVSKGDPGKAAK
jgi:hypothetical protein